MSNTVLNKKMYHPWRFVFLLGTLSLLADLTYEGGRSLTGPFLTALGASPLLISALSGGGELVGYVLRYFSGRSVDKSKKYWPIAFSGYALNLLSVPALAFCGSIAPAAALLIGERAGKGIRNPPRDAMLSYAAVTTGKPGRAFGLHDAMDKTGALIGPLFVAALFYKTKNFSIGFGSLLISAFAALALFTFTAHRYSNPEELIHEPSNTPKSLEQKNNPAFWSIVLAAGFLAAGTADFPFIARHFETVSGISNVTIPILYAGAMASAVLFSLILSRLFDRFGIRTLFVTVFLGISAILTIFLWNRLPAAIIGSLLWGAGFAAQEPIVKSFISKIVSADQRATAYGVFWSTYGVFWFIGSLDIGFLYQYSISSMVIFSIGLQFVSVPLIWKASNTSILQNKNLQTK